MSAPWNLPKIRFRHARMDDFDSIYTIWMQDHVLSFLNFELLSKKIFKPIFLSIMEHSEVYVIEENNCVVATGRIIPGTGKYAHSVSYGSIGVIKSSLEKGYGKLLYDYLMDIIISDMPKVKRIEQIQLYDNVIAHELAIQQGFRDEVIFPDSVKKMAVVQEYENKWYIADIRAKFLITL